MSGPLRVTQSTGETQKKGKDRIRETRSLDEDMGTHATPITGT